MPRTLAAVLLGVFTLLSGNAQSGNCYMATQVHPNMIGKLGVPTVPDFEGSANRYGIHFTEQDAYLAARADAVASVRVEYQAWADRNGCVLASVTATDTPAGRHQDYGLGWRVEVGVVTPSVCMDGGGPVAVFVLGKSTPLTAAHAYPEYPFTQAFIDRFNAKCGETCSVKDDLPSFGPPDPVPLNMTNISPLARSAADCLLSGLGIVNIGGVGDSQVFSSGFRTKEYQQHLSDLWRKWRDELEGNSDPLCAELKTKIGAHFKRDQLGGSLPPTDPSKVPNSCHSSGTCFDVNSAYLPGVDQNGYACKVRRPYPEKDKWHVVPF